MAAVLVFVLSALAVLSMWGGPAGMDGGGLVACAQRRSTNPGGRTAAGSAIGSGRAATPSPSSGVASVPLLLELLGTALESGLTVQGALRVVAGVAEPRVRGCLLQVVAGLEIGASWDDSWDGKLLRADMIQIHDALSFGALTGASVAPLLYAEAQQCRRMAGRFAEKRAAALGVKLVLPLGLCALPAFIALGVIPVVMAMIPQF